MRRSESDEKAAMAPQTTKTDPHPTRSAGFYAGVMPILPFESSLPTVGENVFLAPSATLIGEVRIDEGVSPLHPSRLLLSS